jgi:hypothetical protein
VLFDFQIDPNWYVLVGSLFGTGILGRAGQMAMPHVVQAFKTRGDRRADQEGKTPPPPKEKVPGKVKPVKVVGKGAPRSPNFSVEEFNCKDGTPVPEKYYANLQELMNNLEVLREELGGKAIRIESGYRTPAWNKKVGGKTNPPSRHVYAQAADIKVANTKAITVQKAIERLMDSGKMKAGGIGAASTYTHYDVRGKKTKWTY